MPQPSKAQIAEMLARIDDDLKPDYIALNTVCIFIAIVSVSLRVIARRLLKAKLSWDDFTILLGAFFTISFAVCLLILAHYGLGRHVILLTNLRGFGIVAVIAQVMYNVAIFVIKISILCLYVRLFPQKWFYKSCVGLGVFIFCYSLAQMMGTLLQCIPIQSLWDLSIQNPRCLNYTAVVVAGGVINVVTDVIILVLPIPVLWSLQIARHRKMVLSTTFLMGGIVTIIAIVRIFYAKRVGTVDPTWDLVWPTGISTLEAAVGCLAACIPTYRPIYNRLRDGVIQENSLVQSQRSGRKEYLASKTDGSGRSIEQVPLRDGSYTKASSQGGSFTCYHTNITAEQTKASSIPGDSRNIHVSHTVAQSSQSR